jgi:protein-S-isoprenylcysteine O-methyltransferase Ste14
MPLPKPCVSYILLVGDFLFYLALFIFAVWRRRDAVCIWGSVIAVPSFVLWFIAKLQLGSSFTARAEARALVTRGLYSKIRHPIYFFSTFALIGTAICLRAWWFDILIVVIIPTQLWRIGREERVLREKFSDAYLDYQRRTWF